MTPLFAAVGVDYVQWRALCRAYIWTDFATLFGVYGLTEARRAAIRLLLGWVFLTGLGAGQAAIIWIARDVFLATALASTMMMLWVGLAVLTQSSTLVASEDLSIVGFRPVTSRTYFAVRLTALLWHTLETVVLVGWLPCIAWLTRPDGGPLLALAGALSLTGASLAVTMAVFVLYGTLIRVVAPARLGMLLSYAGAFTTLALTVGVTLAANYLAESDTPGAFLRTVLTRDWRTMWFPGTWFASYAALAQGSRGPVDIAAAVLSLLTLLALAAALRGRLSAAYAAKLTELGTLATIRSTGARRTWSFLKGERRAVALLLTSHLRSDTRFQLAVVMNIVMGIVITAIGTSFRLPPDPFATDDWTRMRTLMMPMFALIFSPAQVYKTLVLTPSHQASWPFFTSPSDRAATVTAGRDAIAAFVLLPTLVLLGLFFGYAYRHAWHALLHITFIGGVAYAALQLSVLLTPRLPFSIPLVQGGAPAFPLFANLLVMVIGLPVFALLQILAYNSGASLIVAFGGVAGLIYLLDRLTRRRIQKRATSLVYIG